MTDVDLGFAFLQRFWGAGYALEAATATVAFARDALRLRRIVAITTPTTVASRPSQLSSLGNHVKATRTATSSALALTMAAGDARLATWPGVNLLFPKQLAGGLAQHPDPVQFRAASDRRGSTPSVAGIRAQDQQFNKPSRPAGPRSK
jgi:hypothetical protein